MTGNVTTIDSIMCQNHIIERICDRCEMLIGYMRVSKADGSQINDLQRDSLIAAGVDITNLYEDRASGKRDDRPGLISCLKALRPGDTLIVSDIPQVF